jgi:drug/metabolite transporter (DMT)-like permease
MTISLDTSNSRPLGIAALLLATFSWGGMFLVSKGVLAHIGPAWFTLIRYCISALVLLPLLTLRGPEVWRKLRAHALPLSARGFAGFGVFSALLLAGLTLSVPSHGAVIVATVPMTTQMLRWVLDGVRPKRATVLTSLLALAGVVVVSGVLMSSGAASTWRGDALVFASTLGWVWYTRGAARFVELDVLEYTGMTVLASLPLLALGTLLLTGSGLAEMPRLAELGATWLSLLYVGAISSAVAVLAFNYGVRTLGAVTATGFMNFVPVSVLLIGLAMGKLPSAAEATGMAMVVIALLIHTMASRAQAGGHAWDDRRPGTASSLRVTVTSCSSSAAS